VDGSVILTLMLKMLYGVVYRLDLSGLRYGPVAGFCEHGNEPSGSIKCWVAEQLLASQEGLSSVGLR
jgi:hypothetical protein